MKVQLQFLSCVRCWYHGSMHLFILPAIQCSAGEYTAAWMFPTWWFENIVIVSCFRNSQNVLREVFGPLVKDVLNQMEVLVCSPVDVYHSWINDMEAETWENLWVSVCVCVCVCVCDCVCCVWLCALMSCPCIPPPYHMQNTLSCWIPVFTIFDSTRAACAANLWV